MRSQSSLSIWTRKLHYYAGLYFLLFIWLFSLSGLLLNHPEWAFAQFWPQRHQSRFQRPVRQNPGQTDIARARDIMAQLEIVGEVEWTAPEQRPGRFAFRVTRPGRTSEIDVDLNRDSASVLQTTVNAWGVLSALHHLNGVHAGDARNTRDWFPTSIWTFSMDALAAGLAFLVSSGIYIWYRNRGARVWGLVALLCGLVACCLLVFAGG